MHAMSIDDMYHVEATLASGAAGVTELVTIDGAGPFVRKKMDSSLANRGVWSALASCACDRLPKVEATYELPDQYVVVYDYVPGSTLDEVVCERGCLSEREAVALVLDVCTAASALHGLGVIHRDISPKNVIVAADGAHLIDLGIARRRVEGVSRDTTSLGTWGFASPEQYGFAQTDARSDVYSIGRILGFAVTGVQPGSDDYQTLLCDPARVGERVRAVVERACAFEPSRRYQSVSELASALGHACGPDAGATGREPTPASVAPSDAPSPGHRRVLAVVCLCVGVVAAAVCLAAALRGQAATGVSTPVETGAASPAGTVAGGKDASSAYAGSSQASSSSAPIAQKGDLQLTETGWSVDRSGYVTAVFALRNAGSDTEIDVPGVRVTATSADGSVLFTQEQRIGPLQPGDTAYGSILDETGGKAPAAVGFELLEPDVVNPWQASEACGMSVTGTSSSSDGAGGTVFNGTVDVDAGQFKRVFSDRCSMVAATVVLRDESGNPIYAATDYVTPSDGGSTPFSIDVYGAPDYASYDVYAQPW